MKSIDEQAVILFVHNYKKFLTNFLLFGFVVFFSSGCSTVTDVWDGATNTVGGLFADDDYISDEEDTANGFPDLASVPDQTPSSSGAERNEAATGLIADSNNAQYTKQVRRQEPVAIRPIQDISKLESSLNEPPPPLAVPSSPVVESALSEDSPPSLAQRLGVPKQVESSVAQNDRDNNISSENISDNKPSTPILSTLPSTSPKSISEFNAKAYRVSSLIATINFVSGSSKLDNKDRKILDEVIKLHNKHGGSIRVTGHASSRTQNLDRLKHKLANFNISMKRANAVASSLIEKGIPAGNLYVGAMSDNEPVFYEVMPNGEYGNQRAEIYMDY